MRKTIITASLLVLSVFLSCATNPVTGEKEFMLISREEEIQMGKQTDQQVVESYGIYKDQDLSAYISKLGNQMAHLSHRPDLPWKFRVLDSPVINAFAVPGGFVYLTRGILAYLNSEAELAGVMGHEIGHVTARHSAKQYSKAQLARLGLGVGMILSEDFRRYAGLAQFGVGLLFLKFSRDNERQSDELGVQYATKAGYDAQEMANFFVTLDRMHPSQGQSGLPNWFSTHPNPEERVAKIQARAQQWRQKTAQKNLRVNRDRYLQKINGIVFGEDPRQGFVEDHMFYHPQLRFQFPTPVKWKINNTARQVQMVSPEEHAVLMLTLESGNTPARAADKFLANSSATLLVRDNLMVNGLHAQRIISRISSPQTPLQVLSYFIQKEKDVFIFHGYCAENAFPDYRPVFQNSITGFRELNDPSILQVKPDRLRIANVSNGGTLRDVFMAAGVTSDHLKELALINGKQLSDKIAANSKIKIVERGR